MPKCRLKRFTSDDASTFSCDEVRLLKDMWLIKFCEDNSVRDKEKDRMYLCLKENLNKFLSNCNCNQKKEIPDTKEMESESRVSKNIREAKQRRERGESPWIKK